MGQVLGNQIIGKVKTVTILKQPTASEFGLATFDFRDEYSIFDYGRMPDDIPFKGESLCRMSAYNFQELAKQGIQNHFIKSLSPKVFEVKTVRILYPQKGELNENSTNFLIPLEIVFRNSLPAGSSMLKRLHNGTLSLEEAGLSKMPQEGERLEKPIVDYATKLEATDRHLKNNEAQEMAFLKDSEMQALEETALQVNSFLNERAEAIGLEHADGKIEMAFTPKRELMLVDTFGTLDEDRFLLGKTHLSKQILRDYYVKTCWQEAIEKKEAGLPYELSAPPKLPRELLELVSNMYKSVCEAWVGKQIWNAPKIEEIVEELNEFSESLKSK
ncbi:MAG: phosphoribosylaminoimidazolesuccinocarboxamide synthase [Candidatus Diapherotrites archaeon]|nr:phosphoribosylaminoimidazolesuccinocarboxamide synthase [Candidatus Diapherotrites archaeon]